MPSFPTYPHLPTRPTQVLFYVVFKGAALAYYIVCGFLSSGFIVNFVVISSLLMADFWVVKNVAGRLLVGLRWWSEAGDDGSEWRFESLDEGQRELSSFDARMCSSNARNSVRLTSLTLLCARCSLLGIFWTLLYLTPAAWSLLCLLAVIKLNLDYLLLSVIAVVLSGSNAWGYHKCSRAQQDKLKGLVNRGIASGVRSYLGLG